MSVQLDFVSSNERRWELRLTRDERREGNDGSGNRKGEEHDVEERERGVRWGEKKERETQVRRSAFRSDQSCCSHTEAATVSSESLDLERAVHETHGTEKQSSTKEARLETRPRLEAFEAATRRRAWTVVDAKKCMLPDEHDLY